MCDDNKETIQYIRIDLFGDCHPVKDNWYGELNRG